MGFVKISTTVHTRLAADTHLADREFLRAAVNREEFLKLRGRTRISVISKRDGLHLEPEYTEIKDKVFCRAGMMMMMMMMMMMITAIL
jgi:hypothetical protein